jgi:RNA polymerase sigma-70 factor (ECF subfamily)
MDCRDPENLRRLYERVGRAALLKTARLVGRKDVAEEILQSSFLKLWDAGLSFPDERAAFAWIYRTCHNAAIDHVRATATRFEGGVDPTVLAGAAGGDDPWLVAADEREDLKARLAGLSEREAQVLVYRLVDGMTQAEIAEVMGLSRKTIVRICAELDQKLADKREMQ